MSRRSMSVRSILTAAEWKVDTHIGLARLPTRSTTRAFISAAALLVKVMARMEPGWTPRSPTRCAIRRVRTRVLPEPAPATTRTGAPACRTASRWGGLRSASRSTEETPAVVIAACVGKTPGSTGWRLSLVDSKNENRSGVVMAAHSLPVRQGPPQGADPHDSLVFIQ